MKYKVYKNLVLAFIMGALYMVLEGLWRGWTNISMLVVGGLCSLLIGKLNERPAFYNKIVLHQCIIGTMITLIIEFISGVILNIWLKFNIWDYSDVSGNIYGQICPKYAILWFLIMPICIFVDDYLRYSIFDEEKPKSLANIYHDLILGK